MDIPANRSQVVFRIAAGTGLAVIPDWQ